LAARDAGPVVERSSFGLATGSTSPSTVGAILLRDILDTRQASGERHCCVVDGGHLGGEHRLNLIARLDPLDDGEHEIDPVLVRFGAVRSSVDELLGQSMQKVAIRRGDGLQQ
jgi:hypothetical protein